MYQIVQSKCLVCSKATSDVWEIKNLENSVHVCKRCANDITGQNIPFLIGYYNTFNS